MIEKVKEIIKLQKELNRDFGILGTYNEVYTGDLRVHVSTWKFLESFNDDVIVKVSDSDDFPYELITLIDDIEFFTILTEEEYKKYKSGELYGSSSR